MKIKGENKSARDKSVRDFSTTVTINHGIIGIVIRFGRRILYQFSIGEEEYERLSLLFVRRQLVRKKMVEECNFNFEEYGAETMERLADSIVYAADECLEISDDC